MKTILTHKRMRASEEYRVWVSRYFWYSQFGVRGRYDSATRSGAYINSQEPGTGFFAHEMDSSSYRRYVKQQRELQKPNFLRMLTGKQPSFSREIGKLEKILDGSQSLPHLQEDVLRHYLGMLYLGKEEELCQRLVRGVKDRMGHKRNEETKYLSSVLTHYKSRIATLMHDAKSAQINIKDTVDEETLKAWGTVCDAFQEMVSVRRLWHVESSAESEPTYTQVFFDMGIFDYIQSPFDTPVMRDAHGLHYYLYPQGIIRARSNTDFDFIPLQEIDFQSSATDLNTLSAAAHYGGSRRKKGKRSDAVSILYGTTSRGMMVGQLNCPKLGLTFYCNHVSPIEHFVKAFIDFRNNASIPLSFSHIGGGIRRVKNKDCETVQDKAHL